MPDQKITTEIQGDQSELESPQQVPILTYHHIWSDDDPCPLPAVAGKYCGHIRRSHFEQQMFYMAEQGCIPITHRELGAWIVNNDPIPRPAVLIDFDDNRLNVFQNAFPILQEFGWPATVFVISSLAADGKTPWGISGTTSMRWEELDVVLNENWLVGAHTRTHPMLDELYADSNGLYKMKEEIVGSKTDIETNLGVSVNHFAYPEGRGHLVAEHIVVEHFEGSRLWNHDGMPVYNNKHINRHRLVANNVSEITSEAEFSRLIDGASR